MEDNKEIIQKIQQIEVKLIEQEHRLIPILINFFSRKKWDPSNSKRKASVSALLWKIFSPATIAVTSGTIVAVLTLFVLVWQGKEIQKQSDLADKQNSLIESQNEYFQLQNKYLQEQIKSNNNKYKQTRTTDLLSILYSLNELGNPKSNSKLRETAFIEFLALDTSNAKKLSNVNLSESILDSIYVIDGNFEFSNFAESRLSKSIFENSNFNKSIFSTSILENVIFKNSNLENTNFDKSMIYNVDFSGSKSWGMSFVGAKIENSNLNFSNSSSKSNLAQSLIKAEFVVNCQMDDSVKKYLQKTKPNIFSKPISPVQRFELNVLEN